MGTPTAPALIQARIRFLFVIEIEKFEFGGGISLLLSLLLMGPISSVICVNVTNETGAPLLGELP